MTGLTDVRDRTRPRVPDGLSVGRLLGGRDQKVSSSVGLEHRRASFSVFNPS